MDPEPTDPRVQSETSYWIDCSVCGPAAAPAPRFASEQALWQSLLFPDEHGWARLDDGRVLCPAHRAIVSCERVGHQVTAWVEHPLDDEMDWRYCPRCGGGFQQRSAGPLSTA